MTSLLVLGAWFGVMLALAGTLTLLIRRCLAGPTPRRTGSRGRPALVPVLTPEGDRARRVVPRVRRNAAPVPRRRPLQVVAADLRRLGRELAAVPAGAPFVRWQALQVAYDVVLVEAAETLEVEHSLPDLPMGSARDIERLRVVCALEAAGLVVQD